MSGRSYSSSDKVLLTSVSAITLEQGKMTNGRRSSPVPQLTCRGGSARCHAFQPPVVQCYNRGSDGHDVQWECKTDMDAAYRFGRIQVSCEGYDYPKDPYVLKGSCGLKYKIELTEEGRRGRRRKRQREEERDVINSTEEGKRVIEVIKEVVRGHGGGEGGDNQAGGIWKFVILIIVIAVIYCTLEYFFSGRHRLLAANSPSTSTSSGTASGQGMDRTGGGGGGGATSAAEFCGDDYLRSSSRLTSGFGGTSRR